GLHLGLNALLPNDIRILSVEISDEKFSPRKDALCKEYNYLFYNDENTSSTFPSSFPFFFHQDLISHYPYKNFNLPKMIEAAKCFEGKHSFKNFYCKGSDVKTFDREIYCCELLPFDFSNTFFTLNNCFLLKVVGNGFLKQMVRLMVGSIWNIGNEKINISDLKAALNGEVEEHIRLGKVAPPEGLYLKKINY
ncbi:MAG: tRNA pseudouridine synthase A, partial [Oligoflexia bacterium]|nr:tRNA pseudouridine synthase A [Oligoflexia bacterium]